MYGHHLYCRIVRINRVANRILLVVSGTSENKYFPAPDRA